MHKRYHKFFDYGDHKDYKNRLEQLRRDFSDLGHGRYNYQAGCLKAKGCHAFPYYYQSALDSTGKVSAWPFPGGPEVLY